MGGLLAAFRSDTAGGNDACMPPVLLELPPNVRHISTAALQGATALAYFAACGQPIAAARGCTAVHALDTDSNRRIVSSVVQLMLDTTPTAPLAQDSISAAAEGTEDSLIDVLHEDTAAQTMPSAPDCTSPAVAKAVGPGSAARHQPGQWPLPPEQCSAAPQQLKPEKQRSRGICLPLELAHALQAAHATPAALGPDDPMHLAALLLPRKAGPPRLLRRKPAKRSSNQLLEAGDGELGGTGSPLGVSLPQQLSRMNALRLKLQQAKRPAWAQPKAPDHDEQEQDLLNFVSEL